MIVKTYTSIYNVSSDSPVIRGLLPREKIVAAMHWIDNHHLFWLSKDKYIYCKNIVEVSGWSYKKVETDYDLMLPEKFKGTKIIKLKKIRERKKDENKIV